MSKTLPAHYKTHNGFTWSFDDDDGAHVFTKKTPNGYAEMRLLASDMTNGNFEFMAENGLTNTNPVPKVKDKRYTIQREFTGRAKPDWVVRFCDEYVSCADSKVKANGIATLHHTRRMAELSA